MTGGLDHQKVPSCILVNISFALVYFLGAPGKCLCMHVCQFCLEEGKGYLGLLVQLTWLFCTS